MLVAIFLVHAPEARAASLEGGESGAVHRLGAGVTLALGSGARAQILPRTRVDLGRSGTVPAFVVALERGRLDVASSAPKSESAVLIRAPSRVACVVAAGSATVIAESGRVTVAAPDVELLVASGDDWRPLAARRLRAFGSGETGSPQPMIAAPAPRLAQRVMLAGGAPIRAEWPAVAGAVRYRVRLGTHRTIETRGTSAAIENLGPGSHAIEVVAIDRYGISSVPGVAGTLRVVGLALPAGASRSKDAIRMHPTERARLIGAEGLELSYGASSYFVAAPRSIGLPPRGGTWVRLRAPGAPGEIAFRLEPIVVSATVSITPKLPSWPDDPIRVRIAPHGVSPSEIRTIVSVNARPIRVSFRREGGALVAIVPRATGRGPWIVRVEVKGPRGETIGREFVEVAQARPSPAHLASSRSH
jgi:hypothetical protein